jgi:hypothetical protein
MAVWYYIPSLIKSLHFDFGYLPALEKICYVLGKITCTSVGEVFSLDLRNGKQRRTLTGSWGIDRDLFVRYLYGSYVANVRLRMFEKTS